MRDPRARLPPPRVPELWLLRSRGVQLQEARFFARPAWAGAWPTRPCTCKSECCRPYPSGIGSARCLGGLRALAGYDWRLCAQVASTFVGELTCSLKRRAKKELRLPSVADAHPGAVAAVQRTDGALRLNVHLHVLALDGVYVRDRPSGELRFHALLTPTRADVEDVARRTAAGIEKILRATGRSFEPEAEDAPPSELTLDEPGLAACYAAAAQGISVSGDRAGLPTLSSSYRPSAASRRRHRPSR